MLKENDPIQLRDSRAGRWIDSRIRARVSGGYIVDAPWTTDGKTFVPDSMENVAWRKILPPAHPLRREEAEQPRIMTEGEITREIDTLNDRLTVLYHGRRGRRVGQNGNWFWCGGCGQNQVDAAAGFDTCDTCLRTV